MKFLLALATFVPIVLGHGAVTSIIVDGNKRDGPKPNGAKVNSPIRQINSIDPITNVNSNDMSCGRGAAGLTATDMVAAKPGSEIGFTWISGSPPILWPHVVGPIMNYIAKCDGDCADMDSTKAKWVKIAQASMVKGNKVAGSGWVQEATFHAGKSHSFNLPNDIPNGNYLIRHEIIALHNGGSQGGAEFYPACAQITVSGGKDGSIDTKNAVSFPGAYKATDPGILINVYNGPQEYQFPGPALVTSLATGATSGGNSNSGSGSSSSPSTNNGNNSDDTSSDDNSGSNSSGGSNKPKPSPSSTSSLTPAVTKPATNNNNGNSGAGSSDENNNQEECDDDDDTTSDTNNSNSEDDNSDSGAGEDDEGTVTVTKTVYVTATASPVARRVHTATATVLVTVTPEATPADSGYPRRRSRIMARHHFASTH